MIQRVQTLFLLGVAICMGAMLGLDLWEEVSVAQNEIVVLTPYNLLYANIEAGQQDQITAIIAEQGTWYIALLAGLSVIVAIFSIFRYNNRLTQIKLNALNSLLIGGTLIATLLVSFKGEEMLVSETEGQYLIGFYLPAAALIFNMLANRFIRRDEQLVRSADRFR